MITKKSATRSLTAAGLAVGKAYGAHNGASGSRGCRRHERYGQTIRSRRRWTTDADGVGNVAGCDRSRAGKAEEREREKAHKSKATVIETRYGFRTALRLQTGEP